MSARPFDELITIGTVIKPHGIKGEVVVLPHSDRPQRFPSLKLAFVPQGDGSARELQVESTFPHKERFVVKFRGVDTMDDAELLRGMDLRIGEEMLESLPEGSYYHHQLLGLAVVTEDGERIGEVEAIHQHSATPTIAIRGRFGRELLIPFVDDFVKDVDLKAKTLKVHIENEDAMDSKANPQKTPSGGSGGQRRQGRSAAVAHREAGADGPPGDSSSRAFARGRIALTTEARR